MFIVSLKASRQKFLLFLLFGTLFFGAAFFFFRGEGSAAAVSSREGIADLAAETNAQRVGYLKTFGWKVDEEACEIVEIAIPMKFGEVYQNYNEIQKKQGFDLENYRGKRVKRYAYAVLNYPGHPDHVRANLLVYNQQIIGGDICSLELEGFQHGFRLEKSDGS